MIPKNVQMPNPNPKYKPPGTPAGGRGGTLMEIEKLIEALGDLEMCAYGYHINGEVLGMDCTNFECLMADAAEEISKIPALQAENDRLKEIIYGYCDMCIEKDGVMWCQSCDEKCDCCIPTEEE